MARRPCYAPMFVSVGKLAAVILVLVLGAASAAGADRQAASAIDVFELSANASLQSRLNDAVVLLFREQRYAEAEKLLRQLVARFPQYPAHHYNLAAALARQGKVTEALDSLAAAIDKGFVDKDLVLKDPDFDAIRHTARFQDLLARLDASPKPTRRPAPRRIKPYEVKDGRAVVDSSNTIWDSSRNILFSFFRFPPKPQHDRVVGGDDGDDAVAQQLNDWFREGRAAGNHGDLYDNRDRGHSRLPKATLPQVAHIEYGEDARDAGFDYGVNANILFNSITFGNSSTALTGGPAWRSQARFALTTPALAHALYRQYLNDHLYVFPEHHDHDPDRGDLIPANTPYMIISQGSSGSDQPFLRAVGEILAAFRPAVKTFLRRKRLVMPTVQMILRSTLKGVDGPADYLSAKAHPSVFQAGDIAPMRMITMANALAVDAIPPRVKLAVVSESRATAGVDYFAPPGVGEVLFDTPSAIARIVRSTRYQRDMVISAANTKDPNGRRLTFHWVVLRGDAKRIEIVPRNKKGSVVELRIPWHERRPVPYRPELSTDRVDIGVFADNGKYLSAPAFISLLYPANQRRVYDEAGRIKQVIYDDASRLRRYVDPEIFPTRDWRDRYIYTKDGQLAGWLRVRDGGKERFTRDGAMVVESDGEGRPVTAVRVRYEVRQDKTSGRSRIVEVTTGKFVTYRYRGPEDQLGEIVHR